METGKKESRHRLLPARVMVYYVMAVCLFNQDAHEEVMHRLVGGLLWLTGWKTCWDVPTKAAIFKGRARVGSRALAGTVSVGSRPLGRPETEGACGIATGV